MAKPIILLNIFTVRSMDEGDFLKRWQEVGDYMRRRPGFVSAKMHKAVDGSGKWFNYAEWASPDAFKAAIGTDEFRGLVKNFPGEGMPLLFQVVEELTPAEASLPN